MSWTDFRAIREQVTLEQILFEMYQLPNLRRHGERVVGPCPIHHGDSPRAFHADLGKNVWFCFTRCRRGGNHLDFAAALEGTTLREAALKIQEFFGLAVAAPNPLPRNPPRAPAQGSPKPTSTRAKQARLPPRSKTKETRS